MKRLDFPGGWYADARPGGTYAVLFSMSHLETSQGRIPLPPGDEPLYHRITPLGPLWVAGQAHYGNCTWLYDGEWRRAQAACGVSPVIFDLANGLHISNCGPIGSQGWRYVARDGTPTGRLVTGDATYGPLHGLSEYTDLGDGLLLGQGNAAGGCPIDGGAVVWDGVTWRLLEPGACRFIRADHDGDQVSVALWKEGFGAVLFWLTVAELRALPPAGRVPGPIAVETPEEHMEAKPLPSDVHAIVVALHARNMKLAQGSDDDRRVLQQKICETVRARKGDQWGWKSNHGIGIANAKDAIAQLPDGATFTPNQRQPIYIWDLFNGSTREPNKQPVMSETEHVEQFFVPVEPVDHLSDQPEPPNPPPVQPPPPAPPSGELAEILARLSALRFELSKANDRIAALEARPAPKPPPSYRVVGGTSRDFGHAHRISVTLEPIP